MELAKWDGILGVILSSLRSAGSISYIRSIPALLAMAFQNYNHSRVNHFVLLQIKAPLTKIPYSKYCEWSGAVCHQELCQAKRRFVACSRGVICDSFVTGQHHSSISESARTNKTSAGLQQTPSNPQAQHELSFPSSGFPNTLCQHKPTRVLKYVTAPPLSFRCWFCCLKSCHLLAVLELSLDFSA